MFKFLLFILFSILHLMARLVLLTILGAIPFLFVDVDVARFSDEALIFIATAVGFSINAVFTFLETTVKNTKDFYSLVMKD